MNRRKAIIGIALFGFCSAASASSITHRKSSEKRAKENTGPDAGWDKLTRKERFLIKSIYKIAKELHPALTLAQFRAQLKIVWDDTE